MNKMFKTIDDAREYAKNIKGVAILTNGSVFNVAMNWNEYDYALTLSWELVEFCK